MTQAKPRYVSRPGPPEYGTFWARLHGFFLDVFILAVIGAILGSVLGAAFGSSGALIAGLAGPAYVISMNANGGTVGKLAVGLRLEKDGTGQTIGYWPAVVRFIVAFFSALALLIGYLWVIWDDKNKTWHDEAAGSVVVKVKE